MTLSRLIVALAVLLVAAPTHAMYNADFGRWMQRDPIPYGGGASLYAYGSNPVIIRDASGAQPYTVSTIAHRLTIQGCNSVESEAYFGFRIEPTPDVHGSGWLIQLVNVYMNPADCSGTALGTISLFFLEAKRFDIAVALTDRSVILAATPESDRPCYKPITKKSTGTGTARGWAAYLMDSEIQNAGDPIDDPSQWATGNSSCATFPASTMSAIPIGPGLPRPTWFKQLLGDPVHGSHAKREHRLTWNCCNDCPYAIARAMPRERTGAFPGLSFGDDNYLEVRWPEGPLTAP